MPTLTPKEQDFILDTFDEYKGIVECKKNDVRSIQKKEKAWKDIEKRFCSMPDFYKRDSNQLKKCWNNLKMKAKKSVDHEKRERKKTGGGVFEMSDVASQKICSMIPEQMHPLANGFDNDAEFHGDVQDDDKVHSIPGPSATVGIEPTDQEEPGPSTHPLGKACKTSRSSYPSMASTFVSAKTDLITMAREEHALKIELLKTQIAAAREEHNAKINILSKQSQLLDQQIQKGKEGINKQQTSPVYQF